MYSMMGIFVEAWSRLGDRGVRLVAVGRMGVDVHLRVDEDQGRYRKVLARSHCSGNGDPRVRQWAPLRDPAVPPL